MIKSILLLFVGFLIGIYAGNWKATSDFSEATKTQITKMSDVSKDKIIESLTEQLNKAKSH